MPAAGEDDVCGRPPGGRTTLRGPGEASCASERQAAGMAAPGRGDRAAQVSGPESRGPSSQCGNSVVVRFEFENCHLDSPSSERADLGQCLPATPPPAPLHTPSPSGPTAFSPGKAALTLEGQRAHGRLTVKGPVAQSTAPTRPPRGTSSAGTRRPAPPSARSCGQPTAS